MGFDKNETDKLLSDVGRMCCICKKLHRVQLHHIVPKDQGGSDDIENAIALCPNCHDEVHTGYVSGRTTRAYTASELKCHRQQTIELAAKASAWKPGSPEYEADKDLVLYYARCLDRPAFRSPFHQEISFADFDQAIEDTMLALNTGYWRTRDGAVIGRREGKSFIINPEWRMKLDEIVNKLETVRSILRRALSLDKMMYTTRADMDFLMERRFRGDHNLRREIDNLRNEAIAIMNSLVSKLGRQPLQAISTW